MTRRVSTFLMTDIQGSTRLWEAHSSVMPGVVRRHEEIIQQAVRANGGTLVKSKGEGDSTFSTFENPTDAVQAAISAQRGLGTEVWPDGISIKARMSVHTGEAEARDGDYFGPTINRCARIREAGHGGQILTSNAVRELIHTSVEVTWVDGGVHRLRDLLRPERIWHVSAMGSNEQFPKLKSLSILRNNLPVQLTNFIGRLSELEHVKRQVRENRLVTVVGAGGEGKTRLVLQTGAELDLGVDGGIWFIALDSLRTREEIEKAIVSALGGEVGIAIDSEGIEKLGLKSGANLLILDNAEHLIEPLRPIVDQLMRQAPGLKLLVSSREPLHQPGEVLYRIPGLSLPPISSHSMAEVESAEAAQLFLSRATARSTAFKLTETNAKPISEICHLLNGSPLALEQAASLVAIMSPAKIVEKLRTRLDWLESEDPATPARHRTISAAIQWSYELLSEPERDVFLMLSLFRDAFVMDAAAFMAMLIVEDEIRGVRMVRALVDKSMVAAQHEEDGQVRFRLLEPMRQFARPLLAAHEAAWMDRYVEWYLEFVSEVDSGLSGQDQSIWLERCQSEQANLKAALEWCEAHGDPHLLALSFGQRKFWLQRNLYSEAKGWISKGLIYASATSEPSRAAVANTIGAIAFLQYDFETALRLYRESLSLYLELGEKAKLAALYNNIAMTLHEMGEIAKADEHYLKAMEICRETGDAETLIELLYNYSIDQRVLGNYSVAEESAYEGLQLAADSGNPGHIASMYHSLCGIAIDQGHYQDAAQHALNAFRCGPTQWNPDHLGGLLLRAATLATVNEMWENAAKLVGGSEAFLEAAGAQRESTRLESRKKIMDFVSKELGVAKFHRLKMNGRSSSADQLILCATEVCRQFES